MGHVVPDQQDLIHGRMWGRAKKEKHLFRKGILGLKRNLDKKNYYSPLTTHQYKIKKEISIIKNIF